MFYVYLLKNERNQTYLGSTNDLRRRFRAHNTNRSTATRGHRWRLVYYEAYGAESDARRRETALKDHGQALSQLKRRARDSLLKT